MFLKLLTSVLFELQKISETNQDSTSKAPNMQIQQMMVPAPLPNPKPESHENLMALKSRGGNRYLTTLYLAKFL